MRAHKHSHTHSLQRGLSPSQVHHRATKQVAPTVLTCNSPTINGACYCLAAEFPTDVSASDCLRKRLSAGVGYLVATGGTIGHSLSLELLVGPLLRPGVSLSQRPGWRNLMLHGSVFAEAPKAHPTPGWTTLTRCGQADNRGRMKQQQ